VSSVVPHRVLDGWQPPRLVAIVLRVRLRLLLFCPVCASIMCSSSGITACCGSVSGSALCEVRVDVVMFRWICRSCSVARMS
jgi:hypothetical protein